jgi:hypothetical protein
VGVPRRCVELAPIGREEVVVSERRRCLEGGLLVMCECLLRSLCFLGGLVMCGVGEEEAGVTSARPVLCVRDCVLCVSAGSFVAVGLLGIGVGLVVGSLDELTGR